MNWKRWAIAAFVLCALLFVAAPFVANAASPWMEVKFLRVLVDVTVDDDLTVRDDLAVTDDTSLTGDLEVDGTTQLDGAVAINGAPTFAEETTFNDLVTHTRSIAVDGAVSETLITVQNCVSNTDDLVLIQDSAGANLVQVGYDGAVSTAAGVVADTVAATSTLTLESVAFSGPITFGAEGQRYGWGDHRPWARHDSDCGVSDAVLCDGADADGLGIGGRRHELHARNRARLGDDVDERVLVCW